MESVTILTAAAEGSVSVVAQDPSVIEWVKRYLSPWWTVGRQAGGAATVTAAHDPVEYQALASAVAATAYEEAAYPRSRTFYTREAGGCTVLAFTPAQQVAYRYTAAARRMDVVAFAPDADVLARAAVRVSRELMRAQLVADGWAVLHGSAAVTDRGRAVLTLGDRGVGKTTVAFTLAASGAGLLANDRVFARAQPDASGVELLAWPSGAAVGLGLMGALGWVDAARARLAAGETAHPSQDRRVTDALLAGRTQALREGARELKAHVRPEEFAGWYGVTTVGSAQVGLVLFPRTVSGAVPAVDRDGKTELVEEHFMCGSQEDSYPDIFNLTGGEGGGSARARADLAQALGALPRQALVLGHDHAANADLLAALAERSAR
ncbi:hypothetical protein GL263_15355 [Streptomyces durbertensis]|uniref:Uncharacterized protein n=1 Tax=Streptomyces durbertensis TaxID=2448886 RepID=A0ABR6EHZ1_9ACTN|nr:hypothetical protein [Streptomyces durbertensis]MBB1244932.1 hypothetical protein [Streptomyces durbertensis]